MKHTPGPWKVHGYGEGKAFVWNSDFDFVLAELPVPIHNRPYPAGTEEANARLIAAAPKLYEVLAFALNNTDPTALRLALGEDWIEQAIVALESAH